jgi:hypothetical protein
MTLASLSEIPDSDQELLRESIQRLLVHGAILREEQRDLYEWCCVRQAALDALANLAGLTLRWEPQDRLIAALPRAARLVRRLRQDETLIAMALWYDFDRAVQEDGKAPDEVLFTVREFNEHLETKLEGVQLPTRNRLTEILRLLERKSLIRVTDVASSGGLAAANIRVLPTIRFIIPFPSLEEWQRQWDRHQRNVTEPEEPEDEPQD